MLNWFIVSSKDTVPIPSQKESKFKNAVNAFEKYMCKYLISTCTNMLQSKRSEARALGNMSKQRISATVFANIISMNVKEVIMGREGVYFGRMKNRKKY